MEDRVRPLGKIVVNAAAIGAAIEDGRRLALGVHGQTTGSTLGGIGEH
jgi:hypothetical protein